MILGGKLPGKVGRCRFLFCKIFFQYRGKIAVMLSFFLLATSLLSERMVSFDPLCGIAARKETMKLAGLRLRVIWTLPVFYYLDLGKIERKNWVRSVRRVRASFLLPWFTHDRDKKLRTCVPFLLYPKRVLHQLGPPTQRENRLLHPRVTPPKSLDTLNMTDCLFSHTLVWFTTPKY